MANQNSTPVAKFDATPSGIADYPTGPNRPVRVSQNMEWSAIAASTATLFTIPVDAVISSFLLGTDDMGGTITANVGFHALDGAAPGTAVDANAIGTLIDVSTAATVMTEIRWETLGIETTGQTAWQLAGLSARPTTYGLFYVVLTGVTGTTPAAGTIAWDVTYTL